MLGGRKITATMTKEAMFVELESVVYYYSRIEVVVLSDIVNPIVLVQGAHSTFVEMHT